MKTRKRIQVTAYRRQLSVQFGDPPKHGCRDQRSTDDDSEALELSARTLIEERPVLADIAGTEEVTLMVETLIERGDDISNSRIRKLRLLMRQLRSRINSSRHKQA